MMAFFIQNYISDGRLVLVAGNEGKKYAQLMRDENTMVYDVIVDESPSSTNMKERVWAILQGMLPSMTQLGMPVPPEIVDYLPLPETLIESWKKQMQPNPQQQQAEQQAQQLEAARMQAEVQELQSRAQLAAAKAQEAQVGAQVEQMEAQADAQVSEADKVVKIAQARKLAAETGRVLSGA